MTLPARLHDHDEDQCVAWRGRTQRRRVLSTKLVITPTDSQRASVHVEHSALPVDGDTTRDTERLSCCRTPYTGNHPVPV